MEAYYSPQINRVEVSIEGLSNQLYSQGLRAYQQWDEAKKLHASGSKRHPVTGMVAKDLALADVSLSEYLTSKYNCGWTSGPVMTTSSTAQGVALRGLPYRSRKRQRPPAYLTSTCTS